MSLQISVSNDHSIPVSVEEIEKIAAGVWRSEGTGDAEISIILVDDLTMRSLNQRYLKNDSLTDVMAFPLSEMNGGCFEGEIYISLDRVSENASSYRVSFQTELLRIVIHGLLHFLGYEDKTDEGRQIMSRRQNSYLQ